MKFPRTCTQRTSNSHNTTRLDPFYLIYIKFNSNRINLSAKDRLVYLPVYDGVYRCVGVVSAQFSSRIQCIVCCVYKLYVSQIGPLVAYLLPNRVLVQPLGDTPVVSETYAGISKTMVGSPAEAAVLGPEHLEVVRLAAPAAETATCPRAAYAVVLGEPAAVIAPDSLTH